MRRPDVMATAGGMSAVLMNHSQGGGRQPRGGELTRGAWAQIARFESPVVHRRSPGLFATRYLHSTLPAHLLTASARNMWNLRARLTGNEGLNEANEGRRFITADTDTFAKETALGV
ncbi:hypothetical protein AGIG_G18913 [Arapaima gigas]